MKRPDNKYQSINQRLNNLFSGVPTILPIPEDGPTDIPIVQMTSNDGKYRLSISRARLDFFYRPRSPEVEDLDFLNYSKNLIEIVCSIVPCNRIGIISLHFKESPNAVTLIKNKYCSDDIPDLQELTIRFNKADKLDNYRLNNITNIQTAFISQNNKDIPGILMQRDINNIPDDRKLAPKVLIKLLDTFFPSVMAVNVKGLV